MPRRRPTSGGFLRRSSKGSYDHPVGYTGPKRQATVFFCTAAFSRQCFRSATTLHAQMLSRFDCSRLVAQAGKRLLPPENVEDVENSRGCGSPCQCRAQRLGNLAELASGGIGKAPNGGLQHIRRPGLDRLKPRKELRDRVAPLRVEKLLRRLIERERAFDE